MKVVSSPSVSVGVALKSDLLELQIHSDEMSREGWRLSSDPVRSERNTSV